MTDNDYENDDAPDAYADPEPEQDPTPYRATQRVNVRSDANLDAPVVRILEVGTRVPVAAIEEGWAELATDGRELVKATYLQAEDES